MVDVVGGDIYKARLSLSRHSDLPTDSPKLASVYTSRATAKGCSTTTTRHAQGCIHIPNTYLAGHSSAHALRPLNKPAFPKKKNNLSKPTTMYHLAPLLLLLAASTVLSNPLSLRRSDPLQHLHARQSDPTDPKNQLHHGPVVYLTDCDVPAPSKHYSIMTYYTGHVNRATPITATERQPVHKCRVSNSTWVDWGSRVHWDCFEGQGTPADVFSFESQMEVTSGTYGEWAGSGKAGGKDGAGKRYTCWKDDHRVLFEDRDGSDEMQCYSGYYCYF
ncbi:hypothetical protein EJ05DRAFT_240583 [Pseudovirgaria hyperparasitica]|uniref:Uncharacterized protein n=1 Tax=Pseudovirgaria hyperparasitica TaxID=470096 RepID=A0A6A6WFA4_9PEZI|nr:uncharacterized protein EJ05DRAFT_240583 [Pseudovirgaria hyperparasitica]KAF2760714.1 hypothetical protein EJ05DRAFT_240583 [Pseudovirgaria hyperparasitica]